MKKLTVGFVVKFKVNADARMVDVDRVVKNIKEAAKQAAGSAELEFGPPGRLRGCRT